MEQMAQKQQTQKIKILARNGDTLFKTDPFKKEDGQVFFKAIEALKSLVPGMLVESKTKNNLEYDNTILEVRKEDAFATRAAALEGTFWHHNGALAEDIALLSGGSKPAEMQLNELILSLRLINKKNIISDFMGNSTFHRQEPLSDNKYHREKLPL